MNGLNDAFFFVIEKILMMQEYFRAVAFGVGKVVFAIALCSMAVNYALTGTGLKENIIKLLKAFTFFVFIMFMLLSDVRNF